ARAEKAVLAGVWVEGADGEPRLAAAQLPYGRAGQFDCVGGAAPREESGDLAVTDVDRDERTGDVVGGEHHARLGGAGALSQDLGVPRVGDAGGVQRFLVDRSGSDGIDAPGERIVDGGGNVPV